MYEVNIVDKNGNFIRSYSHAVHGENFMDLAKEFASKNDFTISEANPMQDEENKVEGVEETTVENTEATSTEVPAEGMAAAVEDGELPADEAGDMPADEAGDMPADEGTTEPEA